MVKRHLPSIEALTSSDDDLLFAELLLSDVREHLVRARRVLEDVERLVPLPESGQAQAPSAQPSVRQVGRTAEQLARLGCRFVELASALTRTEAANDAEPASALRATS
ncbi:MAG: hypothetical protein KF819_38825 [Labilithrix sp.]|nr:hypothetical protein [Labilithrix sp.]